jgi:hypothetical protein
VATLAEQMAADFLTFDGLRAITYTSVSRDVDVVVEGVIALKRVTTRQDLLKYQDLMTNVDSTTFRFLVSHLTDGVTTVVPKLNDTITRDGVVWKVIGKDLVCLETAWRVVCIEQRSNS